MKPTMKTKSRFLILALLASLPLTVPAAHADTFGSGGNTFTIGFVPIGNAGNANDTVNGAGTNYGAVPYNFNMSTYAISQDQLAKASNSRGISLGGSAWVGEPAIGECDVVSGGGVCELSEHEHWAREGL